MRSAPKENMPVVLKFTKDADSPVMFISSTKGVGPDGKGEVECKWVDKAGVPYKGTWHTDTLEKFNPSKDKDE